MCGRVKDTSEGFRIYILTDVMEIGKYDDTFERRRVGINLSVRA